MGIFIFLVLYNFLLTCGVILLAPVLVLLVLTKEKYRARIPRRLGWGLPDVKGKQSYDKKNVWIHALSVGEVTSSLPLLKGLRTQYPDATLILSVTTSSGQAIAHESATGIVDHIIAAPLDSYFSIKRYINALKPDLFIQVETDFWPNWLFLLKIHKVPAFLVNGRFSAASFANYSRFSWLFKPLFDSFTELSMQTAEDREQLITLGIPQKKISTLGNLKLDSLIISPAGSATKPDLKAAYNIATDHPVWICGSTHDGEETGILETYNKLKQVVSHLVLIIAPRDIKRGEELLQLTSSHQLSGCAKSRMNPGETFEVLVLDTLGELSGLYEIGDVAFIGGSMVPQGGHNPVEPAAFGVPVLFGPHMEDFSEIAEELTKAQAAFQVHSLQQMYDCLHALLTDDAMRKQAGIEAKEWVEKNQGVVERHLRLIEQIF